MAYPILGTPVPQFFDSAGDPLASGTITILNPADDTVKASYPTADDANASTNGTSGDITLDSRGEPTSTQLWGRDSEDYKIVIKDSAAATVLTITDIRLPGHSRRAAVTVTSADATPTVAESKSIITKASGLTTITDFDDGQVGDTIFVKGDSDTGTDIAAIANNANIKLLNGKSFRPLDNDTIVFHMFEDQLWQEVSRTYGSKQMGVLAGDTTFTDTTLADVSDLSTILLPAGRHYAVTGYLKTISDGNTQDIKIALQTDNAFQEAHWAYTNVNEDGTTASDSDTATTAMIIDIVTAKVHGVMISGAVLTHATNVSTVDFQAAQGTDAGTTTLERGSWIKFEEIPHI